MQNKPFEFGGSLLARKRKSRRPMIFNRPTHLVLKAEDSDSLLPYSSKIDNVLTHANAKFGVPQFVFAIQPDHVHMAPTFNNGTQYNGWIRMVTGRLAQEIPNLKWKLRPYSRPTTCQRGSENLIKYIERNKREGEFIQYAFGRFNEYMNFLEKLIPPWQKL